MSNFVLDVNSKFLFHRPIGTSHDRAHSRRKQKTASQDPTTPKTPPPVKQKSTSRPKTANHRTLVPQTPRDSQIQPSFNTVESFGKPQGYFDLRAKLNSMLSDRKTPSKSKRQIVSFLKDDSPQTKYNFINKQKTTPQTTRKTFQSFIKSKKRIDLRKIPIASPQPLSTPVKQEIPQPRNSIIDIWLSNTLSFAQAQECFNDSLAITNSPIKHLIPHQIFNYDMHDGTPRQFISVNHVHRASGIHRFGKKRQENVQYKTLPLNLPISVKSLVARGNKMSPLDSKNSQNKSKSVVLNPKGRDNKGKKQSFSRGLRNKKFYHASFRQPYNDIQGWKLTNEHFEDFSLHDI